MTDPTPDLTPLDPASFEGENPPLAAYFVPESSSETWDRSKIRVVMDADPDEYFEELLATLVHEIEHEVLYRVVDFETSDAYDEIDSPTLPGEGD